MKKKLTAKILLCLFILTSVMPPGRAAGSSAQFVVSGSEGMTVRGEEFSIVISIENNPGFAAIQFTLGFDREAVVCTDVSIGETLQDALAAENPTDALGATIAAAILDPITEDGVLANLTFQMKDPAVEPNYQLLNIQLTGEDGAKIPYMVTFEGLGEPEEPSEPGRPSEPVSIPKPTETPEPSFPGTPEPPAPIEPNPEVNLPSETTPVAPIFFDTVDHWAATDIARSVELGLFKGFPDGSFHPDETVSRAQFITVLWREAGSPIADAPCPFTDIADQIDEFRNAIIWGYGQGYVKGTGETTFSPGAPLTRQEAMTILHRYSGGEIGMEMMFTGIYDSSFRDSGEIASWARPSMYWGIYHELIQGSGNGELTPCGSATRAQIAKIMVRYTEKIGKEAK